MRVVSSAGRDDIARVYVADFGDGKMVEFVESVQPPHPREKKWVLIISSLFGCPVGCLMCDAGSTFKGKLSEAEIFAQLDFLIQNRFPGNIVPVEKFKVQFARMGEPAFNPAVLEVLEHFPEKYKAPGFIPSVSTVAPRGAEAFFEKLLELKRSLYAGGHFQLQFSIHSTDEKTRDRLIPIKKWNLAEIAGFGNRFHENGDRKVTLNFALAREVELDPEVLLDHFDQRVFLIKITPLNPTYQSLEHSLSSYLEPLNTGKRYRIIEALRAAGYEVIVSVGELEENLIGSNCGQYLTRHLEEERKMEKGYSYQLEGFDS